MTEWTVYLGNKGTRMIVGYLPNERTTLIYMAPIFLHSMQNYIVTLMSIEQHLSLSICHTFGFVLATNKLVLPSCSGPVAGMLV